MSPGQALDELLRSLGRGGPSGRLDGLLAESAESPRILYRDAAKVPILGEEVPDQP